MDVTPELIGMIRSLILKAMEETTTDELLGAVIAEITAINAAVASRKYRETIQQEKKQAREDRKQGVQKALASESNPDPEKHTDTGPKQDWVPPTNGYYDAIGRFVKAEHWRPVTKPVVEDHAVTTPAIAVPQGPRVSSVLGTSLDGRIKDLNATGKACAAEWQDPNSQDTGANPDKPRYVSVDMPNGSTKLFLDTPEFREQRAREAKAAGIEKPAVVFVKKAEIKTPTRVVVNTHSEQMDHFKQDWECPNVERN